MQTNWSKFIGASFCVPLAAALLTGNAWAQDADENIIIKNRNSSFYDNPIGRTYTGKSPFQNKYEPAEPAPAPEVKPAKPAPAPRPVASETCPYMVNLTKRAPSIVTVGEEFSYELTAQAVCDVGDVTVVDTLPGGVTYVSSEPAGKKDENRLTWVFPALNRGETKTIKVTVKATGEGQLVNCATVSAIPRVCVTTLVGKPQLSIKKTGPEMAQLGQEVAYNIVVQNTGNTIAKNVVVTDTVPEGLTAAGGQKELTFTVGDLAPNQAKSIPVVLKADKRGKHCNKAVASSSNAGKAESEACTTVVQSGVKIAKSTKDKELLINRTASYEIVVSNTGDTDLTGVVVTDTAAPETVIVAAEGATVSGNTASWNIGTLKASEKKTLTVKVLSRVPGKFCDTASVSTAQGLRDSAQDCTEWIGVTGVLVEVVDDPDPIQIGETTTFTIRVTNQGGTRNIEDLNVKATFAEQMDAVTASSGGTISGKNVTFPTVSTLAPKQSVTYTITGKAAKAGDHRLQVDVTTKARTNPIVELESTTVY